MTTEDAINRGNNLAATVVSSTASFAFAPEIIAEREIAYKFDDILLLITGIASIVWYKTGRNKFSRSPVPLVILTASVIVKMAAIFIELKDAADVGDDFGGLILFILAGAITIFLFTQSQQKIPRSDR